MLAEQHYAATLLREVKGRPGSIRIEEMGIKLDPVSEPIAERAITNGAKSCAGHSSLWNCDDMECWREVTRLVNRRPVYWILDELAKPRVVHAMRLSSFDAEKVHGSLTPMAGSIVDARERLCHSGSADQQTRIIAQHQFSHGCRDEKKM